MDARIRQNTRSEEVLEYTHQTLVDWMRVDPTARKRVEFMHFCRCPTAREVLCKDEMLLPWNTWAYLYLPKWDAWATALGDPTLMIRAAYAAVDCVIDAWAVGIAQADTIVFHNNPDMDARTFEEQVAFRRKPGQECLDLVRAWIEEPTQENAEACSQQHFDPPAAPLAPMYYRLLMFVHLACATDDREGGVANAEAAISEAMMVHPVDGDAGVLKAQVRAAVREAMIRWALQPLHKTKV